MLPRPAPTSRSMVAVNAIERAGDSVDVPLAQRDRLAAVCVCRAFRGKDPIRLTCLAGRCGLQQSQNAPGGARCM